MATKNLKEKLKEYDEKIKKTEAQLEKSKMDLKKLKQERTLLVATYTEELLASRDVELFDLEDILDLSIGEATLAEENEGGDLDALDVD